MLLQIRDLAPRAPPFVIEAAGQRYEQTIQFLYLSGAIHEDADLMVEIDRRVRLVRACYRRFGPKLYDMTTAPLNVDIRMLKADVIESLLYACVTWILNATLYASLQSAHLEVLRQVPQRRADRTNLLYAKAFRKTKFESIETNRGQ